MKELKNRKGMDYCFPLGIMQDENGELYYIDPFKSLFLIILMPIRIFFPVKLYKITDKDEKQLAYGRYRDEDQDKKKLRNIILAVIIGSPINTIFSNMKIIYYNVELILQIFYLNIIIISFIFIFIRRFYILKKIKLKNCNYIFVRVKLNDTFFIYGITFIAGLLMNYIVFKYNSNGNFHPALLLLYLYLAPLYTLLLIGVRFKYDDLKFKIIKEVKNK